MGCRVYARIIIHAELCTYRFSCHFILYILMTAYNTPCITRFVHTYRFRTYSVSEFHAMCIWKVYVIFFEWSFLMILFFSFVVNEMNFLGFSFSRYYMRVRRIVVCTVHMCKYGVGLGYVYTNFYGNKIQLHYYVPTHQLPYICVFVFAKG